MVFAGMTSARHSHPRGHAYLAIRFVAFVALAFDFVSAFGARILSLKPRHNANNVIDLFLFFVANEKRGVSVMGIRERTIGVQ